MCAMTGWTPWSSCTATCGKGFRMRTRHYLNRMGRKKCDETRVEKQQCGGDIPECQQEDLPVDPTCTVTQWSDWSPCSGKCGSGVMYRQRHFYTPSADKQKCGIDTMERKTCDTGKDCNPASASQAKEWCKLEKFAGPCRGNFQRWYYDKLARRCLEFPYGGCRGNKNNFESYNECTQMCEFNRDEISGGPANPPLYDVVVDPAPGLVSDSHRISQDCKVTDWSPWSQCDVSCGSGMKEKSRQIMTQPENGGRRCPKRLHKKKSCTRSPCTHNAFGGLESHSLLRETPYEPYTEYSNPSLFRAPEIAHTPLEQLGVGGSSWDHEIEETSNSFHMAEEPGDCVMGEWGPWSPCTHTCGTDALQQRFRSIISMPHGDGAECGPRLQRRFCTLPPCSHTRG